jgi:hypothetical protein
MKFYLPSWNGDMRLVSNKDPEGCTLTLVKPTPQELLAVGAFLRIAEKKSWWKGTAPAEGQPYEGKDMEIPLNAFISKASDALIRIVRPKDRTLNAIKFSDGHMEVVEGATVESLKVVEDAVERAKKTETKEKEAAAASVKRPTPSCPQCQPGAIAPASEVLLSFLSPEQHEQWARERAILVEGQLSGHRYILAHRHSKLARQVGRICFDTDDQRVVHFHDWSVPPEEEILAGKLILENAEPWLRNEATMYQGGSGLFKNPFGDGGDGTESAAFAEGFGRGLAGDLSDLMVPSGPPVIATPVMKVNPAGFLEPLN